MFLLRNDFYFEHWTSTRTSDFELSSNMRTVGSIVGDSWLVWFDFLQWL